MHFFFLYWYCSGTSKQPRAVVLMLEQTRSQDVPHELLLPLSLRMDIASVALHPEEQTIGAPLGTSTKSATTCTSRETPRTATCTENAVDFVDGRAELWAAAGWQQQRLTMMMMINSNGNNNCSSCKSQRGTVLSLQRRLASEVYPEHLLCRLQQARLQRSWHSRW